MVKVVDNPLGSAAALKRLAASHDPTGWTALLDLHGKEILRAARRITGDPASAEDVCQEVLLQIRDHAGKFVPTGSDADAAARSWILRITCNTALKMLRSRRRAKTHEAARPEQANAGPSAELVESLRNEVLKLPEQFRAPIMLRYFGNVDYKQLAQELKLSEVAAKKRVSRGLETLRQRLASSGAVLALGNITRTLEFDAPAQAVTVSPQHVLHWQQLLQSSQTAAVSGLPVAGGLSLVAKISLGAAVCVLVGTAAVTLNTFAATDKPADKAAVAATGEMPAAPKTPAVSDIDAARDVVNTWIKAQQRAEYPAQAKDLFTAKSFDTVVWEETFSKPGKLAHMLKTGTAVRLKDVISVNVELISAAGRNVGERKLTTPKPVPFIQLVKEGADWKMDLTLKHEWQHAIFGPASVDQKAALQKKITVTFTDTKLVDALAEIAKQSGATIVLDPAAKDSADLPINIKIADMTAEQTLDWILKTAGLKYKITADNVVVK